MPIGEALGIVSTTAGLAKSLVETIHTLAGKLKQSKDKALLSEVLDTGLSLQESLLQLQQAILGLQTESAELREENRALKDEVGDLTKRLRETEKAAADLEAYEFVAVENFTAVVHPDRPDAYLCPTCFESRKKSYLVKLGPEFWVIAKYRCPVCQATFGAT